MYRRIIIVSLIILTALCGLSWMGYHSIRIRAEGMEGKRLGEFAEVAEQIRSDVKRKLDEFMQKEQNRPYTDYQYYYVPENAVAAQQQQMPLLRSPIGASFENDLAYGNFQIDSDGSIVTPYYEPGQRATDSRLSQQVQVYLSNIKNDLLPALTKSGEGHLTALSLGLGISAGEPKAPSSQSYAPGILEGSKVAAADEKKRKIEAAETPVQQAGKRSREYRIQSLEKGAQEEQVITQSRQIVAENVSRASMTAGRQTDTDAFADSAETQMAEQRGEIEQNSAGQWQDIQRTQQPAQVEADLYSAQQEELKPADLYASRRVSRGRDSGDLLYEQQQQVDISDKLMIDKEDMVQIRIEPFVPVVVSAPDARQSVFGGQVFMLRHVQIEDRHFLQGFQLNEKKLIEEINDSAKRFMREGMDFKLAQTANSQAAFAAILDFGFGDLVLNLMESDPAWIGRQVSHLRNWYFSIIGIVFLAVSLGLISLWKNARAQIKLAQKKDDFISAVSHELRTPLTSIRMYSEMLEKNWVKSQDKAAEYYKSMRQESERLSRLIENVLDFSRIQKGRKKYAFKLGDINDCITKVVEMMRPYAEQNGFSISVEPQPLEQTAFDGDAVTQIVVNLLDNAVKYARKAEDKTITVRTKKQDEFILIEVEDHGPGVPHHQRQKVFEEFYRTGSEATRETNGTGLGLALVKKFAQAHNGFVEILSAKPAGTIFRVALAVQE